MKIFGYAALAAVGLLMMTSCSEDQSSFNIQDIPGRCLVEGVVKFNEGTTLQDGHFSYSYKPAADLEITLIVENSDYGNLVGQSVFTTTTDSEGKYLIELPAPLNDAEVSIWTADFPGVTTVITRENNKIVSKKEDVVFRGNTTATIHSNGIVYANMTCEICNKNVITAGFTQLATLKGKVGRGIEYKIGAERLYNDEYELVGYKDASIRYVFEGSKADLIVNVNYAGEEFAYNVTSDNAGNWTLKVPVANFPASFDYTVTAMPYDAAFTHYAPVERTYKLKYETEDDPSHVYIDYEPVTLSGFYSQEFDVKSSASFPVASQIKNIDAKMMVFHTLNNGQDTYSYNASNFTTSCRWLSDLLEELAQ